MIKFHEPYNTGLNLCYIKESLFSKKLSGDNSFTTKCENLIKKIIDTDNVLMTTSCTHALEMAIRLLDIKDGDEVIIPSYTYPSTANAVIMSGAKLVYTPIDTNTMMIDPNKLNQRLTSKTKAIIVVHYGGTCCDMDPITAIAKTHNLYIIEDAAQAFGSTYKGKSAGTLGTLGCFSFHNTKNITAGEGGALVINDNNLTHRAKIIQQKGTNSCDFKSGLVTRYEWVDIGSSYSPSDMLMALLYGQLQLLYEIQSKQLAIFEKYYQFFNSFDFECIESYSNFSEYGKINGHIFFLLFKDIQTASDYKTHMLNKDILVYPHFVPLHISKMGAKFLTKPELFKNEDTISDRLIRIPIYPSLNLEDQDIILKETLNFMR